MKITAEMIAVMQAFVDGKKIEVINPREQNSWRECTWEPSWDWARCNYRIKKEPAVFYSNEYANGTWGGMWKTKEQALAAVQYNTIVRPCVKFIEVNERS